MGWRVYQQIVMEMDDSYLTFGPRWPTMMIKRTLKQHYLLCGLERYYMSSSYPETSVLPFFFNLFCLTADVIKTKSLSTSNELDAIMPLNCLYFAHFFTLIHG